MAATPADPIRAAQIGAALPLAQVIARRRKLARVTILSPDGDALAVWAREAEPTKEAS